MIFLQTSKVLGALFIEEGRTMVAAGLILILLSLIYLGYMLNRFKKSGFKSLTGAQKLDFLGNILIVLFFSFLGTMFIINNLS